jgi:hypothetical protein
MRLLDHIQSRIRQAAAHVEGSKHVNTAIATNVGRPGSSTHVESRQRVVQRDGETVVTESRREERNA